MPHASYQATIDAPFDRVEHLLIDKVEKPKKYVGTILWSRVIEHGEGFVIREYYDQPVDLTVREKVYHHPVDNGTEFVFEHMNNAAYTGTFRNILTHVPGHDDQCVLHYIMDWVPHPGTQDKIAEPTAQMMVRNGVHHMKQMAEHPLQLPDFVRAFYDAVDSMQADAMAPLLAEDVRFRIGSNADLIGRDRVVELNRQVMGSMKRMSHDFVDVYQDRGRVFVECFVDYKMADDREYLLPFLTVFEQRDGKIANVKVFGDMMPLFHGWPKHA